ncbi:MAG: hypothetical protein M1504_02835 [Candidatus Marsarchaeota archaeon]|nr:hypothetical protein [Candidatus Marsarchaeota archaeon]
MRTNHTHLVKIAFVIAVILLITIFLIFMGYFSYTTSLSAQLSCTAVPGFACTSPIFNTSGQVSFIFDQNLDSNLLNVSLTCIIRDNNTNMDVPTSSLFNNISTISNSKNNMLIDGQLINIKNLKCWNSSGGPIGQQQPNTVINTRIWMRYKNLTNSANFTTTAVAIINTKVT